MGVTGKPTHHQSPSVKSDARNHVMGFLRQLPEELISAGICPPASRVSHWPRGDSEGESALHRADAPVEVRRIAG